MIHRMNYKYVYLLLILFLPAFSAFSYDYAKDGINFQISSNKLTVKYKPVLLGFDTLRLGNDDFRIKPRIQGAITPSVKQGVPMTSIYSIPVSVPSSTGFKIISYSVNGKKIIKGLLPPSPVLMEKDGFVDERYVFGNYSEFVSPELVEMKYEGIARNRNVANINILLTIFNPQKYTIEIPEEVVVEIEFDDSGVSKTMPAGRSDYDVIQTINQIQGNKWLINENRGQAESKKQTDKIQNLSSGNWIKIQIDREGIYKIDASQLSSMGINIKPDEVSSIKVFGNGGDNLSERIPDALKNNLNEQGIIVNTKAGGELDNIVFYGGNANGFNIYNGSVESFFNYYSNSNYYLLTWGGRNGKRAETSQEIKDSNPLRPDKYNHRIFTFEEKNNAYIGGSGKIWFGGTIFPKTFTNVLDNLDRSGKIVYNAYVAHRSDNTGTFSLHENKNLVADASLVPNTSGYYWDAVGKFINDTISASSIASDGRSVLTLSYSNNSMSTSSPYFNWLEIIYPRTFVPINNEISFFTEVSRDTVCEYTINPFTNTNITGFEISDRTNPKLLKNISVTGSAFVFVDSASKTLPKKYIISSDYLSPKIEKTSFADYRSIEEGYDVIVVSHPLLVGSAQKYKEYRESKDNIRVGVFSTDMIYNEYGSGIQDLTAIRDFIAQALNNWKLKPKYVLLWGDGHYDYKGIQSQTTNFIPSYESLGSYSVFDATDSYSSDDYFSRIVGDDRKTDISLGRIPIDSPERGEWMIEKIKLYENSSSIDSWRNTVLLLADDSPTANSFDHNQHTNQSEALSKYYIPEDINQRKIYLADYPIENLSKGRRKPRVTADLLTAINTSGAVLVNWVGHGNPRVWAHEEVLERDVTIPMMKNMDKLFFTTAATCDFGRFDMPEIKCGSEELLLSSNGGAIGVFAATRVVYSGDNAEINQEFFRIFFSRDAQTGSHLRLGDIINIVKQKRTGENDEKYVLMGDPYLRVHLPKYMVKIDSINGQYVGDKDTINIKALSRVRVGGRIINPANAAVESSYNGTAVISVFDADNEYVAIDVDGTYHNITKFGGALNRSTTQVINGNFNTSFIIPEDISYQKKSGRLNVYSFSDDKRFASGDTRQFILDGVDTTNIGIDDRGPDIEIYLDTTTFKSGDIVSKNPLLVVNLFDEYGINSTGNGIGHRIEAWFDDSSNSVDLTDKFESSLTDSRFGSVEQYIFGLAPGLHKVKVRSWDVFNNFSVAETFFRIAGADEGIVISEISNYPNPFDGETIIRFQHNLNEPFTAELTISTVEGRLVKKIVSDILSVHTSEIPWDAKDGSGNLVATGAYVYSLFIYTQKGLTGRKQGIAAFIK